MMAFFRHSAFHMQLFILYGADKGEHLLYRPFRSQQTAVNLEVIGLRI